MRVKLADVVVREREVDVPDTCPHCGAYLGDGKGLLLCYYEYAYHESKPKDGLVAPLFTEYDTYFRESNAPLLTVFCLKCTTILVESKCKTLPEVQVPDGEDTVWGRCLDSMVFGV
jgi:hypothetical protein